MRTLHITSKMRLLALTVACGAATAVLAQTSATWNTDSDGDWSDGSKWSGGVPADGTGAIATFLTDFTSARTINLDSPRTVGGIRYNDNGGNPDIPSLTITSQLNALTLDVLSGFPDIGANGTNAIVLDVVLTGDDGLSIGANTVAPAAGGGAFIHLLRPANYTGDTEVNRGRVILGVDNGLPPATVLTLAPPGSIFAILALNGHRQELAGLVRGGSGGTRNIWDLDGGTLVLNVPAGMEYDFAGTLGVAPDANAYRGVNFNVEKKGPGTHRFSNNSNAYTGNTTVTDGILAIDVANGLGDTAGGTTVSGTGTLGLAGNFDCLEPLTLSGAGFGGIGAVCTLSGSPTLSGGITLAGNTTLGVDFPLTISSTIGESGSGFGLTKIGTNTLSLSGAHFFTGPMIVTGGGLSIPSGLSLMGSLSISNDTTVSVAPSSQLQVPSLSLGNGGVLTLNLDFGDVGGFNPTMAPVTDATQMGTALTAGGSEIAVNIAATGLVPGAVPLIKYSGAIGGNGFAAFKKGALPPGVQGVLSNDVANAQIVLHISLVVNQLTWYGGLSADWDFSTLNWNFGTTNYQEPGAVGDIVTFDDSLDFNTLNTNVNLTTAVKPALLIANSSYAYSLAGPGNITGTTAVEVNGFGSLALNTANDFSGGSTVNAGVLAAGNDQALGTGSVTLHGGTLATAGGPRSIANDIEVTALSYLDVAQGDLTLSGTISSAGNYDLFIRGGNQLTLTGVMTANGAGGVDLEATKLVLDGASCTNADDGFRFYSLGSVAELELKNNAVYEFGRLSGDPNIRLGQVANDPGLNIFRMSSGLFFMTEQAQTILVGDKASTTGLVYQTGGTIMFRSIKNPAGIRFGSQADSYGEYHLDGGILDTPRVYNNAGGLGTFYFNGGTLRAATNLTTEPFFSGIPASIQAGGALIDSAGLDVLMTANIDGTGGLTKSGQGILTLTGTNTYAGPTAVNEGGLVLGPAFAGSGAITVADGASLGFASDAPGATVAVSSATIGASTGGRLSAAFAGQVGIPAAAAGQVANLMLNGTVPVDVITLPGAVVGTVPLISYTTLSGSGSVATGQLPAGVSGTIVNNSGTKTIELVVSSVAPLVWVGSATNVTWDIATTPNWSLLGSPAVFNSGDNVRFDDTAAINGANMVGVLEPGSIYVSNSAAPFAITRASSSDYLTGGMGITKEGTEIFSLGGANDFTGPILVKEGTLLPTVAAALGSGVAGTTIQPGATLDIGGLNLKYEPITAGGAGVNGLGAVVNTGGNRQEAILELTITADIVFGGVNRWDVRGDAGTTNGVVNTGGNAYKVTKVGVNVVSFNKSQVDPALGDIDVLEGQFAFERSAVGLGDPSKTVTVFSNAQFSLYALEIPLNKKVLIKDGGLFTYGSQADGVPGSAVGSVTLESGDCAIESRHGTHSFTLDGAIIGAGNLTKGGVGLLTLNAANTYSGKTYITNGTLALAATASVANTPEIQVWASGTFDVSSNNFTLAASQTLSGDGTVAGNVTADGTVSPGLSVGALSFNNDLVLAGTTTIEIDKSLTPAHDQVAVTGALTYGGTLVVNNIGATPLAAGDSFPVFTFGSQSGAITVAGSPGDGLVWSFNPATGVLSVITETGPTLGYSISGNNLTFTWTGAYKLVAQTNALSTGLTSTWYPYPNGTNGVVVPIVPGNPTVFFGLQPQ